MNLNKLEYKKDFTQIIKSIENKYYSINSTLYEQDFNLKEFKKYCLFIKEHTKNDPYYKIFLKYNKLRNHFFRSNNFKKIITFFQNTDKYQKIKTLQTNLNSKNIKKIIDMLDNSKINNLSNDYHEFKKVFLQKYKMDQELGKLASDSGNKFEQIVEKNLSKILKTHFGIQKDYQILNNIKILLNNNTIGEIDHMVLYKNEIIGIFEDKLNLDDIGYAYKQLNRIKDFIKNDYDSIILKDENNKIVDKTILKTISQSDFYKKYFIITTFNKQRNYFNLKSTYLKILLIYLWCKNTSFNDKFYTKLYQKIKKKIKNEISPNDLINKYQNYKKINQLIFFS